MKNNKQLDEPLYQLLLPNNILERLYEDNLKSIRDIWTLTREDLKKIGLSDAQINQVIIKLQLFGLDLNKRVYGKD